MQSVRKMPKQQHGPRTTVLEKYFKNAIEINHNNIVETTKSLPFYTRIVMQQLLRLETGILLLRTPDGNSFKITAGKKGPTGILILQNWGLPRRAASGGSIGIAESYIDGEWDSPDVTQLLELVSLNVEVYEDMANQGWLQNMVESIRHWFHENTPSGSKRNIAAHYDLGNEFYKLWLDPSMTYSSAIFADGANSLESAQNDKYRSLAKRAGITPDSHVLEIGCGWGGFAEFVAREIGAKVTGLTISREQLEFARRRIAKAGLNEKVDFKFQDYREETGKYDQVASIEMFEAVGEKYWPIYFEKVHDCLKKGGTAGLQIITIEDKSFESYRRRPDFIQRYIFPGGMLPSPSALAKVTGKSGLLLESERIFPQDYARTLHEWRLKFWEKWDEIKTLGFDHRFKRMWEFYLYYCEAGFRTEGIDVRQMFYRRS